MVKLYADPARKTPKQADISGGNTQYFTIARRTGAYI